MELELQIERLGVLSFRFDTVFESTSSACHSETMPTAIGSYCDAILSGRFHSFLAQFGLTPKSKCGLAASDPGEAVDAL